METRRNRPHARVHPQPQAERTVTRPALCGPSLSPPGHPWKEPGGEDPCRAHPPRFCSRVSQRAPPACGGDFGRSITGRHLGVQGRGQLARAAPEGLLQGSCSGEHAARRLRQASRGWAPALLWSGHAWSHPFTQEPIAVHSRRLLPPGLFLFPFQRGARLVVLGAHTWLRTQGALLGGSGTLWGAGSVCAQQTLPC